MKINFPDNYFKNISGNLLNSSLIKIIKIKNSSSIISIGGKRTEIPFKLNSNKKYKLILKNKAFKIIEIPEKNMKFFNVNKEEAKTNILEKLFFLENYKENNLENTIKNFLFDLFCSIIKKEDEYKSRKKTKSYCFKDKEKDRYFFFFNLFYFNRACKIFIKIDDERNVFLNIFADDIRYLDNDSVSKLIKDSVKNRVRSFNCDFSEDIKSFINKINSLMIFENVDIKI